MNQWAKGREPQPLDTILRENATRIVTLHKAIHETFRTRDRSPELREKWQQACAEFHSSYDELAFPGGYERGLQLLANGDVATAEVAIRFCELKLYFFRSQYNRTKLLRLLKHMELPFDLGQRRKQLIEGEHARKINRRNPGTS